MKKFLFGSLLAGIAAFSLFTPAFAQNNSNSSANNGNGVNEAGLPVQTDIGIQVSKGSTCGTDTPVLICGIKRIVNWVLGLLALIALIILLYAGFKMLTAGGDTKAYDEGFTILKQAAVGLAFIAASYIIVQFIMYVIGKFVT